MQTEEKEMTENEKKKEYLRQYRIHVRRIHRINAEIAELRSMKISPSMNNDGMPHGSSQGDLSGYAAELDRMVSELIKERYVRMVEYQEIVRQIKRLRSENEKDVLFYRCQTRIQRSSSRIRSHSQMETVSREGTTRNSMVKENIPIPEGKRDEYFI